MMAQLFPPSKQPERISQILPTVKCSHCNYPVALAELGDHVCHPDPPVPRPSPSQAILAKIRTDAQRSPTLPGAAMSPRINSPAPRIQSPAPRSRTPQPQPPQTPHNIMPQRVQSPVIPPPRMQTPMQQQQPLQPPPPFAQRGLPPQGPGMPLPPMRGPPHAPARMQSPLSTPGPTVRIQQRSSQHPVMRPPINGTHIPAAPPGPPVTSPLVDARPNGEVNMAGVGRRGFQAAAQAAMIAASMRPSQTQDLRIPPPGMDGRRNNAPRHLNINTADQNKHGSSLSPNTPMSTYSPHSPSPISSVYGAPQPGIASSRTPSPIATLQPPLPPKTPDTIRSMTPDTIRATSPSSRATLSGRLSGSKPLQIDTQSIRRQPEPSPQPGNIPFSPSSGSDYSSSGLAYDRDSDLSPTTALTSLPTSRSETEVASAVDVLGKEKVLFPQFSPKPNPPASLPSRSISSGSAYSYASRTTSKSTGALERAIETVREHGEDVASPPTQTLPMSPPIRSPKLPARSRTTPAMSTTKDDPSEARARSRPRQCTKCNKKIEDGRWIKAEGAGVLCERCWKMMYLPKCRRCNRPIEKQAVSSADGQLKGKYHRECFNCHKCHQPFPDKEFYVFDGKPFCRYHYHEENDSLCAARTCGQPIEGACAVAHTGERFHPHCLTCEHEYTSRGRGGVPSRCNERLAEYWEVDGLMLCERHAMMRHMEDSGDESGELDDVPSKDADARALRRKTQFIDLR